MTLITIGYKVRISYTTSRIKKKSGIYRVMIKEKKYIILKKNQPSKHSKQQQQQQNKNNKKKKKNHYQQQTNKLRNSVPKSERIRQKQQIGFYFFGECWNS